MKKVLVPYGTTGYFSKVIVDYFNGDEKLKPFYQFEPKIESVAGAIDNRKKFPADRDSLSNALMKQHESLINDPKYISVKKNIESLRNENTFTVTTAHQPNLFLGPLYLIYKIISAINFAKQLNRQFPQQHFVPVYWMGTEDHDKDELLHCNLFGKKIVWETELTGAVGRMKTESLKQVVENLQPLLGNSEHAVECVELLHDSYLKEEIISSATRKLLYHFFAKDGLVILDGDDVSLKRLFIPMMEKDLFGHEPYHVVSGSNLSFEKNYETQITPREINLFYLKENIRERIVKEGEQWKVLNSSISFSKQQLEEELKSHPEHFSPNVILRPLYQEMILPNVAFFGGGAEVTYFFQLKTLFDEMKVPFPMVMLRNSVLWIDKTNTERMQKFSIEPQEIFQDADSFIGKFLKHHSGELISLLEERKKITALFDEVKTKSQSVDPSLTNFAEAEKTKALKSLDSIEEKMRRAVKKREEVSVQQIISLKEKLFPANGLQERYDNWMQYYSKYGMSFFETLSEQIDPSQQEFTLLMD